MKTKIDIFSGFLGAGKTTLINKLLNNKNYNKEKIVLIENEFGDIGIDGDMLKDSSIKIKEINAGCICCSVSSDFTKAIKDIIDMYKPNRILIEPSGVAKLSEIIEICKKEDLKDLVELNLIITVVDPLKFNVYLNNFSDFYVNQIANAKVILISRSDFLDKKELIEIKEKIINLNKKIKIITSLDELDLNNISPITLNDNNKNFKPINQPIKFSNFKITKKSLAKKTLSSFQTLSFSTSRIFTEENITTIISKLKDKNYGTVLRAKGFLKCTNNHFMQFNFIPDELSIQKANYEKEGKICIIGCNLNKDKLKELFLGES